MNWNAACYQQQYSYIWEKGERLLEMLNPQAGDRILDLGCGTGQLSQKIASKAAHVIGLDSDPAMIFQAQSNYPATNFPNLSFQVGDAVDFHLPTPVDAVFSNAALHWVTRADAAAHCIANALKPGGHLVCELGGKGNVQTIMRALEKAVAAHLEGPSAPKTLNPWYFPSLRDYVEQLEQAGLEVVYAHLFDRPTPLGEAGLAGWLSMFSQRWFADTLSAETWENIVKTVEAEASSLYQQGKWIADYRRLRIIAMKPTATESTSG
ncbi:MAG: methyltransferase domain-containing protein [Cyanobacteria bacterium J06598_3]